MKARTKIEKLIETIKFEDVTFPQIEKMERVAYKTKKNIACLRCGGTIDGLKRGKCPICGQKLKIIETQKRTYREENYIQKLEVKEGMQVIRVFLYFIEAKKWEAEKLQIIEVMRWFYAPENKIKLMAIPTSQFYYEWSWVKSLAGQFEFKRIKDQYGYTKWDINIPFTHGKIELAEEFKYCGINKNFSMSAYRFFECYKKHPKIEYLAKAEQMEILKYICYRNSQVENYFEKYYPAMKTVIKEKYKIEDGGIWFDYLDCLIYFQKDISAVKYCCPKNLSKAHDTWLAKKKWAIEEEKINQYLKKVEAFKGIDLGKDNITIEVIPDIKTMIHEARVLELCYITSNYFEKEDSIILSAKVDNEPTEGIEIDIKERKIIQIRGKNNQNSPYHEQIKTLVNKNYMKLFRKKEEKDIEFGNSNGEINQRPRSQAHKQQSSLCAI